jgi:hypothetical protein
VTNNFYQILLNIAKLGAGILEDRSTNYMLNREHIRKTENPKRVRSSLRIIDIIISNTRSFETASIEEINTVAWQQRLRLSEFRTTTTADILRGDRAESVGCGKSIKFRRHWANYTITTYNCGRDISTPNAPHICCICEALLTIDNRRRSYIADTTINQRAFEEENLLIEYRDTGLIRTGYLGQYVEIERQRRLQLQVDQFAAFRNSAIEQDLPDSASLENVHRALDDRSDSDHE